MGWLDRFRGKRAKVNVSAQNQFINSYDLTEDKIEIGRTTDEIKGLTLKIPGKILIVTQVNTQRVSRSHATLEWDPAVKKYRLIDQSKYGTVLNEKCLPKNGKGEIVENGSNIFISPFMFQLFYK